jgi:hypothetical protein
MAHQAGIRWRRELFDGPHDLTFAVAWSFMIGSTLFALGSFPPYFAFVDGAVVGATFVVGSVFFTAAAYGQFVQAVDDGRPGRRRLVGWRPAEIVWWAAAVQLIGTLFFNVNTVRATIQGLTAEEENRLVWAPDVFGCIAFLVASTLAWIDVCQGWWAVRRDDAAWWSSGLNEVGSIFFGLAAIGAYTLTTTGEFLNVVLVNAGTFAGGICFLVGAYLLLPPRQARSEPPPIAAAGGEG